MNKRTRQLESHNRKVDSDTAEYYRLIDPENILNEQIRILRDLVSSSIGNSKESRDDLYRLESQLKNRLKRYRYLGLS